MTQPATSATLLLRRITEIYNSGEVDRFTLRRLRTEAETLKRVDKAAAYTALGAIACLEGDLSSVVKNHDIALSFDASESIYLNYSASLSNLGQYSVAADVLKRGYEINPGSLPILDILNRSLMCAGRVQEMAEWIKEGLKLNPPSELAAKFDRYKRLMEITRKNGWTDNALSTLMARVFSHLLTLGCRPAQCRYETHFDGGDWFISYVIKVRAAMEQVLMANAAIATLRGSSPSEMPNEHLFVLLVDEANREPAAAEIV